MNQSECFCIDKKQKTCKTCSNWSKNSFFQNWLLDLMNNFKFTYWQWRFLFQLHLQWHSVVNSSPLRWKDHIHNQSMPSIIKSYKTLAEFICFFDQNSVWNSCLILEKIKFRAYLQFRPEKWNGRLWLKFFFNFSSQNFADLSAELLKNSAIFPDWNFGRRKSRWIQLLCLWGHLESTLISSTILYFYLQNEKWILHNKTINQFWMSY